MSIDKIIPLLLLSSGSSLCIVAYINMCLSFVYKASNFAGIASILIPPSVFLMLFIGTLLFSFSDCYGHKWFSFFVQILVSALNLGIYMIQRKIYQKKIEDEIR